MFWLVNVAAFYGVVVNVLEFLAHYGFVEDHFRVYAFLPELVVSVGFMRFFEEVQVF